MLNKLKLLYAKSPSFIKILYGTIPNKIKYGKVYRKWNQIIKEGQDLNRNPFITLEFALKNFQFYKDLYVNININEWHSIPLLDKETIQEKLPEFELKKIKKFYITTGGVTGAPAMFYQSNNVWFKEMAFLYGFFSISGYTSPILKASFRGGDFSKLKDDKYWFYNPHHYEIHFSPFHLNDQTIYSYVEKLNKVKPLFFHGYPSVFITLAKYMSNAGLKLQYKPKCVFLISEGYDKKDILYLKSFFNCEISSFYGQSERLVFAIADESLETYKVDQNYGYFELVDKSGNIIKKNNIEGEIVATSYDNFAMPLIRYKTGDFTSYFDFESKVFKKITGKWGQQFLYGFKKEEISLTALNLHSEELNEVIKIQFIQEKLGEIKVFILLKSNKNQYLIEKIQSLLNNRVDNVAKFKIYETTDFIKSSRGKLPLIVSRFNNK